MRPMPTDLAHCLEARQSAYRQLATRPCTSLRRELIRLSTTGLFHPYWEGRLTTAARSAMYAGRGTGS
ncbi:hypothetical protein F9278_15235 [Streptomyces phaeolivaceus]|uniref:Uncharacterized protein n=1 Tax=Streptomyces phaeolivaceus TaxID=2653200 RepID=A0A5P8K2S8_9ACTN|nr:hypothetical protein [Streptomyces phaeolivaceus]QFQ97336.1 hypothetical protein F9278_15235 [Streptomyces phaeolivaceus]